jgi:hypothetical protein
MKSGSSIRPEQGALMELLIDSAAVTWMVDDARRKAEAQGCNNTAFLSGHHRAFQMTVAAPQQVRPLSPYIKGIIASEEGR